MKKWLPIILPLLLLTAGVLGAWALINARQDVNIRPPEVLPPLIRIVTTTPQTLKLEVSSQGTVMPRTETSLVTEVAGRVIEVSPSLVDGGFFGKGNMLLTIDPRDYELALASTRADVAQAKHRLAREFAEAQVARREWQELGDGHPSPLSSRALQVAEAKAALISAQAKKEQAEYNLERTKIHAPFEGRVRNKHVDIGQYVIPGNSLATIYSVDAVEIRLPIPDNDLAYINLPLNYQGESAEPYLGPPVLLYTVFAGESHTWNGRIVRTEGEIDRKTRVVYAVAKVDKPYSRGKNLNRPPLAVGMFVEATISGKTITDVVVLPRAAMRGKDQVLVVDLENRLWFRDVDVLRIDNERVFIESGLDAGEQVNISILDAVTDGMKVRTFKSDTSGSLVPPQNRY